MALNFSFPPSSPPRRQWPPAARPRAPILWPAIPMTLRSAMRPNQPDWIVSDRPRPAPAGTLSADGWQPPVWHCTAGSFHWTFFERKRSTFLMERAVTTAEGDVRLLEPGDVAYFSRATTALWKIDDHVRKIAFCRPPAIRLSTHCAPCWAG